jgi:hypothetical protein
VLVPVLAVLLPVQALLPVRALQVPLPWAALLPARW